MRWLDGITDSMDVSLSEFWDLFVDCEGYFISSKGLLVTVVDIMVI